MKTNIDTLILNGAVLTMAEHGGKNPSWVAIAGGQIAATGTGQDWQALAYSEMRLIDAEGATVMPGFNDAHVHVFMGGIGLGQLNLFGVKGRVAFKAAIDQFRAEHPDLPFLAAILADYAIVSDDHFLNRHILDELCPDIPCMITSLDFHTAWCNSAALRKAGIERGAKLSVGHEVVLDDNGVATGELRELEAGDLVRAIDPATAGYSWSVKHPFETKPKHAPERAQDKEALWRALNHCASYGITSVQNMDGTYYQLDLLSELDAERGLPVRVRMPFQFTGDMKVSDLAHAERWRKEFQSENLRCDFIKIFADGVIDSGTAFMVDDYANNPGHRGTALFSDADLQSIITAADAKGFQVAVHCVGDGAVRQVLDAYEVAAKINGRRDARHRVEHIEQLHEHDIGRFKALGVVASMQPTHVPMEEAGYFKAIGESRRTTSFRTRELLESGADLVFSTDWPISELEPSATLIAAMTRPHWPGTTDQRLGLMAVLRAYTQRGAWVEFQEATKGQLAPGMLADIVVLNCDITKLASQQLGEVEARCTLLGGRMTHGAAD